MLKDEKNKMLNEKDVKTKEVEVLEEFHFPGGLEYKPMTIKAKSREEAEAIWEKKREKVN